MYGLFALAATARGVTQLVTQYAEAPLAYVLSLVAGIVYIVATVTLARGTATSRRVALVAVSVELVGVLDGRHAQRARPGGVPAGDRVVALRERVRLRAARAARARAALAAPHPPRSR